jgi:PAS domain S-box-containing protein
MTEHARDAANALSSDFLGALFAISGDGTIQFWNDRATAIFGFASDEVIGRTIYETIVPPELAAQKREWLAAADDDGLQ